MARTEPWRLDSANYPHHAIVPTRFQDLDVLGHINNVAMAALFETARINFNHSLGLSDWRGHRWLVAQVLVNYIAEAHFPAPVEISTGIGTIGNRSWQILATAVQDGEVVATADVVLVMEKTQGVTGLPDEFRAGLAKHRVRTGT